MGIDLEHRSSPAAHRGIEIGGIEPSRTSCDSRNPLAAFADDRDYHPVPLDAWAEDYTSRPTWTRRSGCWPGRRRARRLLAATSRASVAG
jgi:hypothetical protein